MIKEDGMVGKVGLIQKDKKTVWNEMEMHFMYSFFMA